MENKESRTFEINPKIEMKKVRFTNRYGITLAGDLAERAAARYETRRHRIYLRKITVRQWIILVCSPMLTGSVLAQSAYAGFREWRLPLRERIPELKR